MVKRYTQTSNYKAEDLRSLACKSIADKLSGVSHRKGKELFQEYEATVAMCINRPDWVVNLEKMCKQVESLLEARIARDERHDFLTPLTAASVAIGRFMVNYDEEVSITTYLRLGDVFIDGFYEVGLIRLVQPEMNQGSRKWFIGFTEQAKQLREEAQVAHITLRDSTGTQPEATTSMLRTYAGRRSTVVKRRRKDDPLALDTAHTRALDAIQGQPWLVNKAVLDKVEEYKEFFGGSNISKQISVNNVIGKGKLAHKLGKFYQLVDIDYRGRFYTMEPFFQFQGTDFARGLFLFAEGTAMTQAGWDWLYVHTANSANISFTIPELEGATWLDSKFYIDSLNDLGLDSISLDKMRLRDRKAWVDENIEQIMWLGLKKEFYMNDAKDKMIAEAPVSFLAACIEIYRLSVDPSALTHLPISVDGTSNGWQHLAAMARDEQAAALVGMTQTELPLDFYLATGQQLLQLSQEDEVVHSIISKMPMKHLRKYISKRGSMTRAYSAGASAIAENMWDDIKQDRIQYEYFDYQKKYEVELKKIYDEFGALISREAVEEKAEENTIQICNNLCLRIAKYLVQAIKEVCPGPLDSMKYFMQLAAFEVGERKWVDEDNNNVASIRTKLKNARSKLIKMDKHIDKGGEGRQLTDDEIDELNEISQRLAEFKSVEDGGNHSVALSWQTPSGFQVISKHVVSYNISVHAYINAARETKASIEADRIEDKDFKSSIVHEVKVETDHVARTSTISAISPNIVHSYDSAHLAMTVDGWDKPIGVIHDSYSTLAPHIPELLTKTKDTFKEIYNDNHNIFEYLRDEILSSTDGFDNDIPEFGEYKLEQLDNANYFFA